MDKVVTIAQEPALIPQVALWLWLEWSRHKGRTLDMVEERLRARAAVNGFEQTFVVLAGGRPVATASLVAQDLPSRLDLTPWLASVFVEPLHRGHGHASLVVRSVEAAARAAGVDRLWLFTRDAFGLYAGLGWESVGAEVDDGMPVTLMQQQLAVKSFPATSRV